MMEVSSNPFERGPTFNPEHNPYIEKIKDHRLITESWTGIWPAFENKKAIVDLGCGNGHFLQEYLGMNPDAVGLGVEKRYKRVFKTAEKMLDLNQEVSRSRVVKGDVFDFFEKSPSDFWEEVWVQFPDPWPKARHAKNRMVGDRLYNEIHRILKSGGSFCFRSDTKPYWETLIELNTRRRLFPIAKIGEGDQFLETHPKTLFQQKFLKHGILVYSLKFQKG